MGRSLAQLIAGVRRGITPSNAAAPANRRDESHIDYRDPTAEERNLLCWLIQHGTGSQDLLQQIERVRVRPSCTCGCPSLELLVPPSEQSDALPSQIVADFVGRVDGLLVGLMLRTDGDRLSDLEVYDLEGSNRTFGLPAIETLEPFAPSIGPKPE